MKPPLKSSWIRWQWLWLTTWWIQKLNQNPLLFDTLTAKLHKDGPLYQEFIEFKTFKNSLLTDKLKEDYSFVKTILNKELVKLVTSESMKHPHYALTKHSSYINNDLHLELNKPILYMSSFNENALNYYNVGITQFYNEIRNISQANNLLCKDLGHYDNIRPCKHGSHFFTFHIDYFLANNLFMDTITIDNKDFSV